MHRAPALALASAFAFAALAGCTAGAAGTSNFSLTPAAIGWDTGQEAHFFLNLSSSLFHQHPSFTIDRRFAIEEIQFDETGLKFGADYSTKDPDAVGLRLARGDNASVDSLPLDADHPSVDVYAKVPDGLRDSEYTFQLKLFNVGWVKSDAFRVDHP